MLIWRRTMDASEFRDQPALSEPQLNHNRLETQVTYLSDRPKQIH
jgi:hypothetical protein